MNEKVLPTHLKRGAVVYLRQSTLKQVHEHRESTTRQYGLQDRALQLGWPAERVEVIDEDLGRSGSSTQGRSGFQRLAEGIAHGRVGAVFALEVSRLARSSADWHRLLELCGLADVVIADEQAVYSPHDYNDRLLLGLKGQMSEAELYWMRLRLEGGRLSKVRRGEYHFPAAAGYQWDAATSRFRFDPDEQVQRAVRLVFERFRLDGSAYAVVRYFLRHGLELPRSRPVGQQQCWAPPQGCLVLHMLHNPVYAGAYVYGRSNQRMALVDGQVIRRHVDRLPPEQWKACIHDRHPAYISWEEFMANQRKLDENRTWRTSEGHKGAAREGEALLQGLALCGRCGQRMDTRYRADRGGVYSCVQWERQTEGTSCFIVSARPIDEAVVKLFLQAVQPPEIELALVVAREAERQAGEVDHQWKLRLERAQYEARLAERRYKAVDPDNRVVAGTLERDWEEKLREVEQLERDHQEVRSREKLELSEQDRARILALCRDLPALWQAPTTTHAERKNLLRMLVRQVTLTPVEVPVRMTRVQVLWQTGAVSELTVRRAAQGESCMNSPDAIAALREMFDNGKNDREIASELNRRGLRTGRGRTWDHMAVRRVRHSQGLLVHSPKSHWLCDRRSDGLYSVHGIAARFGVTPGRVRDWVRVGLLQVTEGGGKPRHAMWFKLDQATEQRLEQEAAKLSAQNRGVDLISHEGAL